ncbi:MAG TPA: hypothetical protein PKB07_17535, partial [Flavilitoribacter sp.]|nr:hypothetical protein [Flavilitoribacter sp.]
MCRQTAKTRALNGRGKGGVILMEGTNRRVSGWNSRKPLLVCKLTSWSGNWNRSPNIPAESFAGGGTSVKTRRASS